MQKSIRKLMDDKPKKVKANGLTTDEDGGSSSDALAEME
jgi:hypothetical protein